MGTARETRVVITRKRNIEGEKERPPAETRIDTTPSTRGRADQTAQIRELTKSVKEQTKAIRAFCLDCIGDIKEVKNCTAEACALHPFRPK